MYIKPYSWPHNHWFTSPLWFFNIYIYIMCIIWFLRARKWHHKKVVVIRRGQLTYPKVRCPKLMAKEHQRYGENCNKNHIVDILWWWQIYQCAHADITLISPPCHHIPRPRLVVMWLSWGGKTCPSIGATYAIWKDAFFICQSQTGVKHAKVSSG